MCGSQLVKHWSFIIVDFLVFIGIILLPYLSLLDQFQQNLCKLSFGNPRQAMLIQQELQLCSQAIFHSLAVL